MAACPAQLLRIRVPAENATNIRLRKGATARHAEATISYSMQKPSALAFPGIA